MKIRHSFVVLLMLLARWLMPTDAAATEPPIVSLAFAPDGTSLVAASQAGVQVFRWPDLQPHRAVATEAANLRCLAFSPDGQHLAVGGGHPAEQGMVEIFSWPDCRSLVTVGEHEDSVTAVAWLDTEHFFSASLDRQIHLCDRQLGQVDRSFVGHSRGVTGLCLLPGETTLISVAGDQLVRVWEVSTGRLIRSLSQHTQPIHAVALSPAAADLPLVASAAGDRTIRFWQPTIGRLVRYVSLSSEPLNVAWTQDGSRVLAGCVDGRLHVIDPVEVTVLRELPAIHGWAYAVAVHPSDNSCVVGGTDGQLRRLELPSQNSP